MKPETAGSLALDTLPARSPAASAWADDADWALVARVGQGEQAALATLYRRHYERLCRFVCRITSDPGGVDDIVNEVMLVVWQKAAATTPQAQVSTWIMGIAYRKALKAAERSGRHACTTLTEEMTQTIGADDMNLARMESEQLAKAALGRLPAEQRAVMELVYHDGLNYGDIAAVLDCPENTVKTRIFHARRKLRSLWRELAGSEHVAPGAEKS